MRIVDITGDGCTDLLQAQESVVTWYPSLGGHDFGSANITFANGIHALRVAFADAEWCVYLADMSGDGLAYLVRVRNGNVCYWPNLSYGRFGPKTSMDNAPLCDSDETFDQCCVRLADVDGSGTSDLLYLTPEGAELYRKWAGNSSADMQRLYLFPHVHDFTAANVIDLLGISTSCLV
jgi:hypothetical protein